MTEPTGMTWILYADGYLDCATRWCEQFILLNCNFSFFFFEIFTEPEFCHRYTYGVRAIVQCIPAWLRFIQCLRRYRDTKRAFPHLVNAGKYSTTFFTVTFAALYSTHKGMLRLSNLSCFFLSLLPWTFLCSWFPLKLQTLTIVVYPWIQFYSHFIVY